MPPPSHEQDGGFASTVDRLPNDCHSATTRLQPVAVVAATVLPSPPDVALGGWRGHPPHGPTCLPTRLPNAGYHHLPSTCNYTPHLCRYLRVCHTPVAHAAATPSPVTFRRTVVTRSDRRTLVSCAVCGTRACWAVVTITRQVPDMNGLTAAPPGPTFPRFGQPSRFCRADDVYLLLVLFSVDWWRLWTVDVFCLPPMLVVQLAGSPNACAATIAMALPLRCCPVPCYTFGFAFTFDILPPFATTPHCGFALAL